MRDGHHPTLDALRGQLAPTEQGDCFTSRCAFARMKKRYLPRIHARHIAFNGADVRFVNAEEVAHRRQFGVRRKDSRAPSVLKDAAHLFVFAKLPQARRYEVKLLSPQPEVLRETEDQFGVVVPGPSAARQMRIQQRQQSHSLTALL